jgi:hypothetical protein
MLYDRRKVCGDSKRFSRQRGSGSANVGGETTPASLLERDEPGQAEGLQ